MAFIFVPPFNEGDKQINPDTGVEYIYNDGAWRALGPKIEDEFDTLDNRYIKRDGTTVVSDYYRLRGPNAAGDGTSTFQVIDEGKLKLYNVETAQDSNTGWAANVEYVQRHVADVVTSIPSVNLDGYATEEYVDNAIDAIPDVNLDGYATETYVDNAIDAIPDVNLDGYATETYVDNAIGNINLTGDYLPITGGTLTSALKFQRSNIKTFPQFKISPNNDGDYATSIYSLGNGEMRLRTSHTDSEGGHIGSHIILHANGGQPTTKIYHLVDPTQASNAANKQYVDRLIAAPARLAWKWDGSKDSNSDPGTGKFYYHPGGSGGVQGYLRFSFESNNGCHLGDGKFGDTNVTLDYGPYGAIWLWRSDIEKWKLIMQFRAQTWRWNYNNHFEFGIGSRHGRNFSDLVNGVDYYITIGGYF